MIYNFSEQANAVQPMLAELRDVSIQQDPMRFRFNLERIAELMAYEISKTLAYQKTEVQTPLGSTEVMCYAEQPVVASIMRAGLPMHQGLLRIFDRAPNAFVSAYRKHHKDGTFEINLEYVSCPSLEGKTLIICDPMLATGASMAMTVQALEAFGKPKMVHLVTAIAAADGVDYVKRKLPKAQLWVGAIDEELTAKSYIVPGLGDAGDLAFGEKLQE